MTNKTTRRQFIKVSALGIIGAGATVSIGASIVLPPDMDLPNPYPQIPKENVQIPDYHDNVVFFDEHQYKLVATLAALIIPTDDTPGATEARVADFIDEKVAASKREQKAYKRGLNWLDSFSVQAYGTGNSFLSLDILKQIELLRSIDEARAMRYRKVSGYFQRLKLKFDKIWDNHFGVGNKSTFFAKVRRDVIHAFYSHPASWEGIGYFGPPQPEGYPDFSDPPSSHLYTGKIRLIRNTTCQICHHEVKHPTGGLIAHNCKTCHRPHSPWPYDKNRFHLENHVEVVFPTPNRKWKDG